MQHDIPKAVLPFKTSSVLRDSGLQEHELLQKDFIKYHHTHGDEGQRNSLHGFARKLSTQSHADVNHMRRAEHNAIQRKQDVFRSKLQE